MTSYKNPGEGAVIVTASPYGLGPASNLVAVATLLARQIDIRVVVDHVVSDYVTESLDGACRVDPIDRDRWWLAGGDGRRRPSVVVAVHEPRACRWATATGTRSIFVDSLAWMRSSYPLGCDPDLYVWQRYFSLPSRSFIDSFQRAVDVPPIMVPKRALVGASDPPIGLLVNLGGMLSPVVTVDVALRYASRVVSAVSRAAAELKLDTLLCLPKAVAARLKPASTDGLRVASPTYDEFRSSILNAALVLTVPGVETVFEVLDAGRPLVFLPALNGTQAAQLSVYRDHGIGLALACSSADRPAPLLGIDLTQMTRSVIADWTRTLDSSALTAQLIPLLTDATTSVGEKRLDAAVARFRDLGNDGAESTVNSILGLLDASSTGGRAGMIQP